MPAATPDEWLYTDWLLIVQALNAAKHEECRCYECDTLDSMIEDIAWYWDLEKRELMAAVTAE
ncbi:hypothetical protein [Halalkalicoccus sp. NIPERK01]|uniref:hypothetical protein n=1 Tax=Halalkalicoccus sp. NIPERK01 TaxID=3053469 RepID=UPI00256EF208|nr:hypothetical protein [Halalkalicoccus sp. NIPERK01]MDL5363857.1 hypothetical protein [Halalkalicoccus sp. NIPERK01]